MLNVLLTGFGPFPGAPFNPTAPLVRILARRPHPGRAGVQIIPHIFSTSYAAVDRDLPALLLRERPAAILMFGLANRTRHLRIETRARNARSCLHQDAEGYLPTDGAIEPNGPALLPLRAPAARLVAAARAAAAAAAPSRDAGDYLCNYLCWRASRAAETPRGPRVVVFVHVPRVLPVVAPSGMCQPTTTLGDLIAAGEAILLAAITAARRPR